MNSGQTNFQTDCLTNKLSIWIFCTKQFLSFLFLFSLTFGYDVTNPMKLSIRYAFKNHLVS